MSRYKHLSYQALRTCYLNLKDYFEWNLPYTQITKKRLINEPKKA